MRSLDITSFMLYFFARAKKLQERHSFYATLTALDPVPHTHVSQARRVFANTVQRWRYQGMGLVCVYYRCTFPPYINYLSIIKKKSGHVILLFFHFTDIISTI